jgi:hypothetical protein
LTVSSAAPEGAAANTFGLCAVFKLRRDGPRTASAQQSLKTEQRHARSTFGIAP